MPARTDSFALIRKPIPHGPTPYHGKAIALPSVHPAGDDDDIIHTLLFEITGLQLSKGAAFGNQIKRFRLQQGACPNKFLG